MPSHGAVTIVCLANSRKLGGRCVAGKLFGGARAGAWIRPVGRSNSGELDFRERQIEQREPQLLELIRVPLGDYRGAGCHTEDYAIQQGVPWQLEGKFGKVALHRLVDVEAPLWPCAGYPKNDRVRLSSADHHDHSLRLISVADLQWSQVRGSRGLQYRACFEFLSEPYDLVVTDPVAIYNYGQRGEGEWVISGRFLLTVSLGEPFEGFRYKLVAGIIAL